MQTLLFSSLLNNISTQSPFCLPSSFSFPLDLHCSLALLHSPNQFSSQFSVLSNFSSPLSFFSPVGALSLSSCFHILLVVPGWCGRVGGCRQQLISYLRINHEVLSTQSSSDPSASLSASAGSLLQTHTRTLHWLMAVTAPVHSTNQPASIPSHGGCRACSAPLQNSNRVSSFRN